MKVNDNMALLLQENGICADTVPADDSYPIWQKKDRAGRPYWGTADFWGLDKNGIPAGEDLSQLEWDGNEVHLDAFSKDDVPKILKTGIGIVKSWKKNLDHYYPTMGFYILASFDKGDALVNQDDYPNGFFSLTLRFWASRDGNTVVRTDYFSEWDQPALLEACGNCTLPV